MDSTEQGVSLQEPAPHSFANLVRKRRCCCAICCCWFPPPVCSAEVENLNATYLEHFARVHSQPLLQNYSWTLKDKLDGIGMPIGVLWANHHFA